VRTWNPLQHGTNYAIIQGVKTPGVLDVVGADAPRKWDERPGYGLSGAWLIYCGDGLSHFSLKFRLYSVQDWLDWWAFHPIVAKRPKPVVRGDQFYAAVDAISIWHPYLDALGIHSIVVENELEPVLTEDTGEHTIEVKVAQFRAPKGPAAAKPVAAKPTPAPDPVEQKIIDNNNIIQRLAG